MLVGSQWDQLPYSSMKFPMGSIALFWHLLAKRAAGGPAARQEAGDGNATAQLKTLLALVPGWKISCGWWHGQCFVTLLIFFVKLPVVFRQRLRQKG